MCKDDPFCDGEFVNNGQEVGSNFAQSENDIQDHFARGSGEDLVVEPSAMGVDSAINIGSQINDFIVANSGAQLPGIISAAEANPGEAVYFEGLKFNFDGGPFTGHGRSIGRFTGSANGFFTVNDDGTYNVEGTLSLDLGNYSWVLDGDTLGGNIAIAIGSALPNFYRENSGVPQLAFNGQGKQMKLISNQDYSFRAYGVLK